MICKKGDRVRVRESEFAPARFWDLTGVIVIDQGPEGRWGMRKVRFPGFGEAWIHALDLIPEDKNKTKEGEE